MTTRGLAEGHRVGPPRGFEDVERLVEEAAAVGSGGASGLKIVGGPAGPQTCDHAAAADLIDRGQRLRQLDGCVLRSDQNRSAETHLFGRHRRCREDCQGVGDLP